MQRHIICATQKKLSVQHSSSKFVKDFDEADDDGDDRYEVDDISECFRRECTN